MAAGKRVYRSALRAEQARRTRLAVLDAAGRCFVERGYARTTMRDIAQAAGVAPQTVFAQGSKAALLLACVDRTLAGDDEARPLMRRDEFRRLLEATDIGEKLQAFRSITVDYVPRTGPIMRAFASAAAVDDEIAAAWTEYGERRYADNRALVESFAPWLRPGLDVDRAVDVFWAVFAHPTSDALVGGRGWDVEQYADWLVDALERLLLDRRGAATPAS
ncbi:TetR/AcrR family transcriptional regulator [Blastococcus deserti]|uniref:TetR/AcrR family transcriptional regulator n=1 Tax=Blastococcus deserti TaxID=2259033 RepID=A0ABW4XFL1_9ACTN